ncbi:uncharacterized protein DS421_12g372060 [Arachis hypogaea]|nr:uncharacterized protein DS421_12g372060 [Arachis hypogaea]
MKCESDCNRMVREGCMGLCLVLGHRSGRSSCATRVQAASNRTVRLVKHNSDDPCGEWNSQGPSCGSTDTTKL